MNFARRMIGKLTTRSHREPEVRWKIVNLTRQSILADRVNVADSAAQRNRGLLGRDGLEAGEGLWIVPCEAVHTFGMRFPIDLVYVDRAQRVRKVRSRVPPWRMSACLFAHSVVELAADTVHQTHTKAGDKLEFSPLSHLVQTVETISPVQTDAISAPRTASLLPDAPSPRGTRVKFLIGSNFFARDSQISPGSRSATAISRAHAV